MMANYPDGDTQFSPQEVDSAGLLCDSLGLDMYAEAFRNNLHSNRLLHIIWRQLTFDLLDAGFKPRNMCEEVFEICLDMKGPRR